MPYTLRMPEVAANATHATLVCWNKAEGERIEAGHSIADLETDKAVVELPVEQGGVIGKLLVANGAEVQVGAPIAILLQEGEVFTDESLPGAAQNTVVKSQALAPQAMMAVAQPIEASMAPVSDEQPSDRHGRVFSSPVARLLAKQHGLDLTQVTGSGPNGRVTKHDVVKHVDGQGKIQAQRHTQIQTAAVTNSVVPGQALATVTVPSATRRTIAKRLSQSKLEVPHFYLRTRCDVDGLLAARKQVNKAREVPISINDFVIRACAVALVEVPQMNVSWRDDGIHAFERADISVAVDTPNGLMTPIIFDANHKTLSAISAEMRALARLARDGRLQAAQFQGGTFSVSNLGMFGVTDFDAIINPPQAGILAVGAVQSVPVVREGAVVPGRVMDVVLSVDHRVVDGAMAARWMAAFRALIEQPLTMLV
jgi:pyruvate dehydrogenase E2 component (dihydrolipoamide acetyltransferase)